MNLYAVCVLVHLLSTVYLVGHALFWFLSRRRHAEISSPRQEAALEAMRGSRWPPPPVPVPLRLPVPGLAALVLFVALASGLCLLALREDSWHPGDWVARASPMFTAKLAAVATLVLLHGLLARRVRPLGTTSVFVLTLLVVVLSVWIRR